MTDLSGLVLSARAAAEGLMTDVCRITRTGDGAPVFDEDTGQYVAPADVLVYEGPCRLQVKADINSNVIETTAGEREWTYLTAQLQVPVEGTETVRVDNVAEIVECAFDQALVGRRMNVQGIYHKSQAGYRRLRVREVVA